MRICSPANEYTVLTRLDNGRRLTALDINDRPCLLVVEKGIEDAKRLAELCQKWAQNRDFTDFYEYFTYKGGGITVFAYHQGGASLDKVLENMPYPQRAAALTAVFELILRQSLPEEILIGIITARNLRIYPSGKAQLMYDLPKYDGNALRDTVVQICGEFSSPELDALLSKLENTAPCNPVELYTLASAVSDRLFEFTPPERKKATVENIRLRAEDVKTKALLIISAMLTAAVLIAGFITVGVLFYKTVIAPPRVDNGIKSIGTVAVSDGA